MRRFVMILLQQALAWPRSPAPQLVRWAGPRAVARVAPSAATCRRAWGEIRALYRLKDLLVPA